MRTIDLDPNNHFCVAYTKEGYQILSYEEWQSFDFENLHRPFCNGPAIENAYGYKAWYFHGRPHRINGPAIMHINGVCEWWINGKSLDEKKVTAWIKENQIDISTDEGQVAFALRWS